MNKNKIKPLIIGLFEKNSLIDRDRNSNNINACSKKPLDSIIHQIDRFFIDLEDQSSIFNWLPYKCLTDDEIAYIGFFYINRATDNRLITHNYKGKDVTYDFLQILPEHLLKKIKPDFIIDIIKNYQRIKKLVYQLYLIQVKSFTKCLRIIKTLFGNQISYVGFLIPT